MWTELKPDKNKLHVGQRLRKNTFKNNELIYAGEYEVSGVNNNLIDLRQLSLNGDRTDENGQPPLTINLLDPKVFLINIEVEI